VRWHCRDRVFDLDGDRVLVMGVVNVTPDSFSDGGRFLDPDAAVAHGRRLLAEGADVLDVGAESTRPGSAPVPAAEQIRRLRPVLEGLRSDGDPCLSVDTASAEVAGAALALGARIVNDVTAFDDPAMAGVVAGAGAGAVLMHMRGRPATMQDDPRYDDVVAEVRGFLSRRIERARSAGVAMEAIAVDPGIGFGKAVAHTLELIARLGDIVSLGRPVVLGASRKSFIGRVLGLEVDERLEGSLAAAAIGAFLGARVIRVHDVRATARAARLAAAVRAARRD
jgi:dihydropteroate synthase